MTTISVPMPEGADWINANDRTHHHAKARLTRIWRQAAREAAAGAGPQPTPVRVIAYIAKPRGGRWDPNNLSDTTKACIDGFTDAGLWPDDNYTHVIGPDHRRAGKAPACITFVITPWTGDPS